MARLVKYTSFRSRIPASSGTRPDYLHNIRHLEQKMRSLLQNKKIEDFTSNVELQDAALGYQLRIAEAVVQKLGKQTAVDAKVQTWTARRVRLRHSSINKALIESLFATSSEDHSKTWTALENLPQSVATRPTGPPHEHVILLASKEVTERLVRLQKLLSTPEAMDDDHIVSQFVANLARIGECCKQLQRRRNYPMLEVLVDDLDAAAVFAVKRQHEPNFKTALRSLATSLIEQTPFITELITKPKNQPPEDL